MGALVGAFSYRTSETSRSMFATVSRVSPIFRRYSSISDNGNTRSVPTPQICSG